MAGEFPFQRRCYQNTSVSDPNFWPGPSTPPRLGGEGHAGPRRGGAQVSAGPGWEALVGGKAAAALRRARVTAGPEVGHAGGAKLHCSRSLAGHRSLLRQVTDRAAVATRRTASNNKPGGEGEVEAASSAFT